MSVVGGSFGWAENVIDASKEWQAHQSTSPVSISTTPISPAAIVSESTAPVCECDSMTPQERLDQSTYAFTGLVLEAEKPKNGSRVVMFDVDEIFKGSPTPEIKVLAEVDGSSCDLPYIPGQSYLVFTKWEWGSVVTSRCMGTKFLDKTKTAALGPSEELKEKLYIRLRNACMGRIDTPCCLSSLKAMRAGYYIPEPAEGGCPDGTVPDRLHCGGSYTWCISVLDKDHH